MTCIQPEGLLRFDLTQELHRALALPISCSRCVPLGTRGISELQQGYVLHVRTTESAFNRLPHQEHSLCVTPVSLHGYRWLSASLFSLPRLLNATAGYRTVVPRAVPGGRTPPKFSVLRTHRPFPWRARVRMGFPSHEALPSTGQQHLVLAGERSRACVLRRASAVPKLALSYFCAVLWVVYGAETGARRCCPC